MTALPNKPKTTSFFGDQATDPAYTTEEAIAFIKQVVGPFEKETSISEKEGTISVTFIGPVGAIFCTIFKSIANENNAKSHFKTTTTLLSDKKHRNEILKTNFVNEATKIVDAHSQELKSFTKELNQLNKANPAKSQTVREVSIMEKIRIKHDDRQSILALGKIPFAKSTIENMKECIKKYNAATSNTTRKKNLSSK